MEGVTVICSLCTLRESINYHFFKVQKKENEIGEDFYCDDSFLDDNDDVHEPDNEGKRTTNSHYYRVSST